MVEKILREPYRVHSRNISSVSEISVTGVAEPLKRDEKAEIRCVLLCDSETERNCVYEAVSKSLHDGQSGIRDVIVSHHHWEQPHSECAGNIECRFCIRRTEEQQVNVVNGISSADGFFRFAVGDTVFRLMLLSKDKQNLLKIISYDFLIVGMQVHDNCGHLDESIWEFEWKRLDRHSKKAVAPILLFGYFRDVLKLGHGDISLEKTIEESRTNCQKVAKKHHAIPRYCDFVTGDSCQLCDLFLDAELLYRNPGYILQQCAIVNNQVHFSKILMNPNVTQEDLTYADVDGDNPVMIAAKMRHKDMVSSVLRCPRFDTPEDNQFLEPFIHARNFNDATLLSMVALQGPELEEQKLLILRKEIQLHCVSDLTHEADQLKLQRCLRNQLKSSAEAAIILEQARALQGIPRTQRELKAERGKVWSRLFFASLLLSLIFNAIDTGSDILIMIRYYYELVGETIEPNNNTCGDDDQLFYEPPNCNASQDSISIQCFPSALSPESKFGYTLFFLLVPLPFFIYEFFTSRHYDHLVQTGSQLIGEMAQCNGVVSFVKCYLKAVMHCISFVCCICCWPIAVLFIKYYNDGKYYLAKGAQRAAREKKIEASEVLYSTARVMEVSLESSFQPTIQLYIMFPVLVRTITASSFSLRIFTVCKTEDLNFPMLKPDQTISIVTSILSLAWCFTSYHATLKRGALDRDLAALFYRAVLFLSVLFQIIGRLFILVLFSYSFGPGMYFPVLIFLGGHILLMTILHFIFSDATKYWQKGGFLNLSFFHYMIGNGLANIYIHNWIRMDPLLIPFSKPLQHVSTLVRQFTFDLIFVAENITLLVIALNSNIEEIQDNQAILTTVLLGFSFVGLILKCVYYRYLHIWAWLIMDYITKKEDGHFQCLLFSNMYFCGELKERELLLCCVPRPIFQCLNQVFGDRYFSSTGTSCSWCSAIFTLILIPLVFSVALLVLCFVLGLTLLFLPVFLVTILPCILVVRCRQWQRKDNIIKIVDSDSRYEEGFPLAEKELAEKGLPPAEERFPLSEKPKEEINDDLKTVEAQDGTTGV